MSRTSAAAAGGIGVASAGTDRFAVVVVGSGFGGSIAALAFGKLFAAANQSKPASSWEKVCILERGQWWISHEIPTTPKAVRDAMPNPPVPNMREFLEDHDEPFGLWAHPDNEKGLTRLVSMARTFNRRGLYDYRMLASNMSAICASGVGGGSLVYSNVTVRPDPSVWASWPTEHDGGPPLLGYFSYAEKFIGTNPITTIAGLSKQPLERSKVFAEAVNRLSSPHLHIVNEKDGQGQFVIPVPLSITDIPGGFFQTQMVDPAVLMDPAKLSDPGLQPALKVMADQIAKYRGPMQTNVCERQGRCNLGCLPGARHTLNKRLYQALVGPQGMLPLVIETLAEARRIEYEEGEAYPYVVHYRKTRAVARDADEVTDHQVVRAKTLIVAAGTLGTYELLRRSADAGLALSGALGLGFSPNGDLLGYIKKPQPPGDGAKEDPGIDITRGPINTSHAMFGTADEPFVCTVEDTAFSSMVAAPLATFLELDDIASRSGPPNRIPFLRKLSYIRRFGGLGFAALLGLKLTTFQGMMARMGFDHLPAVPHMGLRQEGLMREGFRRRLRVQESDFQGEEGRDQAGDYVLHTLIRSLFTDHEDPFASPRMRLQQFYLFSGMAVDRATGTMSLQGDAVHVDWRPEDNEEAFRLLIEGMQSLADVIYPGSRVRTPTWNPAAGQPRAVDVLHPLGGCRMGDDAQSGVVNGYGQVFRPDGGTPRAVYPGFYLMDGSVIPQALGVNSSLTISAVAFRCAEKALRLELQNHPGLADASTFLPQ